MPAPSRLRRALPVAVLTLALASSGVLSSSLSATADTAPAGSSTPATVSSDQLPTVQIDGVAWTQVIVGDTVYVGGQFGSARPAGSAPGVNTVPRSNLLAYDLRTGVLKADWSPAVNGVVRALAASSDGSRLYVGGDFSAVGPSGRAHLAAFDLATGALDPKFKPIVNTSVRAIAVTPTTVYYGGFFTAVDGVARTYAAASSVASGALLPWSPILKGGTVAGITVSPDGGKIVIAGSFTSADGSARPGYGLAMVAATGDGRAALQLKANSVIRNASDRAGFTSAASDGDSFYVTGYALSRKTGNFEGAARLSWADGSIIWLDDCHGDSYSVQPVGSVIYTASHHHDCSNIGGFPDSEIGHRALAYGKAATGTVKKNTAATYADFAGQPSPTQLNWYPDFDSGTFTGLGQGPWHVTGNAQWVVYAGEFTTVNNKPQQGLERFAIASAAPNRDGPRTNGTPVAKQTSAGVVRVSMAANWDRDNENLTYTVVRDGNTAAPVRRITVPSRWYSRPTITADDTGLGSGVHSYYVITADPFGNTVVSPSVSVTTTGTGAANTPAPGTILAADAFARTVDGGWGPADAGGTWKVSGSAANYAVDGTSGIQTITTAGSETKSVLPGVASLSTESLATTRFVGAPGGGSAIASVLARVTGSADYRARAVVGSTGSVSVGVLAGGVSLASAPAGFSIAAGDAISIRFRVFGSSPTTLQARVWKAGTSEPTTWQIATTDATAGLQAAGGAGIDSYLGAGATGLPRSFAWSAFSVTAV